MPADFVCCFKSGCPRSAECLRHVAIERFAAGRRVVMALNAAALPAAEACAAFVDHRPRQMAWGWRRIYASLPCGVAKAVKADLLSRFGPTVYYRIGRGERLLTPEEQEFVRSLFRRYGQPGEPEYEHTVELPQWRG